MMQFVLLSLQMTVHKLKIMEVVYLTGQTLIFQAIRKISLLEAPTEGVNIINETESMFLDFLLIASTG